MKSLLAVVFYLIFTFCLRAESSNIQLAIGDKAPDFTVMNSAGKPITLSTFRGKLILLNFWTSACIPCRVDHPALYQIYNSYKNFDFDVISVSLDTKKDQWLQAVRADQLTWPNNGIDLQGWKSKLVNLYNLKETPTSFLISEEGEILQINQDEITLEQTVHYLIFDQPRFYPVVASEKIYFNVISKYSIIDGNGSTVLKGRSKEIAIDKLLPGEYTLNYENKSDRF